MPKIIGQAEQLAAMKSITRSLKEMETTNKFLESSNPTGEYTISFKNEAGQMISIGILAKDKGVIDDLAMAYKKQVADEVLALAAANRIELDDDEKLVFGIKNN